MCMLHADTEHVSIVRLSALPIHALKRRTLMRPSEVIISTMVLRPSSFSLLLRGRHRMTTCTQR